MKSLYGRIMEILPQILVGFGSLGLVALTNKTLNRLGQGVPIHWVIIGDDLWVIPVCTLALGVGLWALSWKKK